jgi:hypothetical protein
MHFHSLSSEINPPKGSEEILFTLVGSTSAFLLFTETKENERVMIAERASNVMILFFIRQIEILMM